MRRPRKDANRASGDRAQPGMLFLAALLAPLLLPPVGGQGDIVLSHRFTPIRTNSFNEAQAVPNSNNPLWQDLNGPWQTLDGNLTTAYLGNATSPGGTIPFSTNAAYSNTYSVLYDLVEERHISGISLWPHPSSAYAGVLQDVEVGVARANYSEKVFTTTMFGDGVASGKLTMCFSVGTKINTDSNPPTVSYEWNCQGLVGTHVYVFLRCTSGSSYFSGGALRPYPCRLAYSEISIRGSSFEFQTSMPAVSQHQNIPSTFIEILGNGTSTSSPIMAATQNKDLVVSASSLIANTLVANRSTDRNYDTFGHTNSITLTSSSQNWLKFDLSTTIAAATSFPYPDQIPIAAVYVAPRPHFSGQGSPTQWFLYSFRDLGSRVSVTNSTIPTLPLARTNASFFCDSILEPQDLGVIAQANLRANCLPYNGQPTSPRMGRYLWLHQYANPNAYICPFPRTAPFPVGCILESAAYMQPVEIFAYSPRCPSLRAMLTGGGAATSGFVGTLVSNTAGSLGCGSTAPDAFSPTAAYAFAGQSCTVQCLSYQRIGGAPLSASTGSSTLICSTNGAWKDSITPLNTLSLPPICKTTCGPLNLAADAVTLPMFCSIKLYDLDFTAATPPLMWPDVFLADPAAKVIGNAALPPASMTSRITFNNGLVLRGPRVIYLLTHEMKNLASATVTSPVAKTFTAWVRFLSSSSTAGIVFNYQTITTVGGLAPRYYLLRIPFATLAFFIEKVVGGVSTTVGSIPRDGNCQLVINSISSSLTIPTIVSITAANGYFTVKCNGALQGFTRDDPSVSGSPVIDSGSAGLWHQPETTSGAFTVSSYNEVGAVNMLTSYTRFAVESDCVDGSKVPAGTLVPGSSVSVLCGEGAVQTFTCLASTGYLPNSANCRIADTTKLTRGNPLANPVFVNSWDPIAAIVGSVNPYGLPGFDSEGKFVNGAVRVVDSDPNTFVMTRDNTTFRKYLRVDLNEARAVQYVRVQANNFPTLYLEDAFHYVYLTNTADEGALMSNARYTRCLLIRDRYFSAPSDWQNYNCRGATGRFVWVDTGGLSMSLSLTPGRVNRLLIAEVEVYARPFAVVSTMVDVADVFTRAGLQARTNMSSYMDQINPIFTAGPSLALDANLFQIVHDAIAYYPTRSWTWWNVMFPGDVDIMIHSVHIYPRSLVCPSGGSTPPTCMDYYNRDSGAEIALTAAASYSAAMATLSQDAPTPTSMLCGSIVAPLNSPEGAAPMATFKKSALNGDRYWEPVGCGVRAGSTLWVRNLLKDNLPVDPAKLGTTTAVRDTVAMNMAEISIQTSRCPALYDFPSLGIGKANANNVITTNFADTNFQGCGNTAAGGHALSLSSCGVTCGRETGSTDLRVAGGASGINLRCVKGFWYSPATSMDAMEGPPVCETPCPAVPYFEEPLVDVTWTAATTNNFTAMQPRCQVSLLSLASILSQNAVDPTTFPASKLWPRYNLFPVASSASTLASNILSPAFLESIDVAANGSLPELVPPAGLGNVVRLTKDGITLTTTGFVPPDQPVTTTNAIPKTIWGLSQPLWKDDDSSSHLDGFYRTMSSRVHFTLPASVLTDPSKLTPSAGFAFALSRTRMGTTGYVVRFRPALSATSTKANTVMTVAITMDKLVGNSKTSAVSPGTGQWSPCNFTIMDDSSDPTSVGSTATVRGYFDASVLFFRRTQTLMQAYVFCNDLASKSALFTDSFGGSLPPLANGSFGFYFDNPGRLAMASARFEDPKVTRSCSNYTDGRTGACPLSLQGDVCMVPCPGKGSNVKISRTCTDTGVWVGDLTGCAASPTPSPSSSTSSSASISPSISATVSATPSRSASASSSASVSPSVSSNPVVTQSSASPTPAPSNVVRMTLRVVGGGANNAGVATIAEGTTTPLVVVNSAWPAASLRVKVATTASDACVGSTAADELQVVCSASNVIDSPQASLGFGTAVGLPTSSTASVSTTLLDALRNASAMAGPALTLVPSAGVRIARRAGASCITVADVESTASFQLRDARRWTASDPLGVSGTDLSANVDAAAASSNNGYLHPHQHLLEVKCQLVVAPSTSAASTAGTTVLSTAFASALVARPPLPIPRAIYLYRSPAKDGDWEPFLQSMRDGSKEPAPSAPSSAAAAQARYTFHGQLKQAAKRLYLRASGPLSSSSSSSTPLRPADAVSGSTILVIVLDAASSPSYALSPSMAAEHLLFNSNSSSSTITPPVFNSLSLTAALPSSPALHLAVYVGTKRCEVLYVSVDGTHVHVKTPPFAEICSEVGNDGGCPGHLPITLQYEQSPAPSAASSSQLWWWETALRSNSTTSSLPAALSGSPSMALATMPGPAVSCPPWCPSLLPPNLQGVVPLAVPARPTTSYQLPSHSLVIAQNASNSYYDPSWMGVVVPASSSGDILAPLLSSQFPSTAGLLYTSQCVGYTEISTGACTNISDPRSLNCALGTGENCRACPTVDGQRAGLCPGGNLFYPLPSYYTASLTSGVVVRCPPPADERCLGYDPAAPGGILCGEQYKQGSYLCSACNAPHYYRANDGTCTPCPASASSEEDALIPLLRTIGFFAAAGLGIAVGIGLLAFTLTKLLGGSFQGGSRRIITLLAWSITLIQVISQAARTAPPGLPPFVQSLFNILQLFQFDNITTPSECLQGNGYPFWNEVLQMSLALVLSFYLAVYLLWCYRPGAATDDEGAKKLQSLQRNRGNNKGGCLGVRGRMFFAGLWGSIRKQFPVACLLVLVLIYPLVTNTALDLLSCQTTTMPPLALSAVDGYEGGSSSSNTATATVSLLSSNPSFICFKGSHRSAGIMAAAVVPLYCLAYPMLSWLWASRRLRTLMRSEDSQRAKEDASSLSGLTDDLDTSAAAAAPSWQALQLKDSMAIRAALANGIPGRSNRCAFAFYLLCCGRQRGWRIATGRESFFSFLCCLRPLLRRCSSGGRARNSLGANKFGTAEASGSGGKSTLPAPLAYPLQLDAVASGTSIPLDGITTITDDYLLSHFISSQYRASTIEMRAVDMLSIAVLACIDIYWPKALLSTTAAIGRGVVYIGFLLGLAWFTWSRSPLSAADGGKWQLPVQVLSLIVAALAGLLTHVTLAYGISASSSSSLTDQQTSTVRGLSYALLIGCFLLVAALVIGFVSSVVTGSKLDRIRTLKRREAKQKRRESQQQMMTDSSILKAQRSTTMLGNGKLSSSSSSSSSLDVEDAKESKQGGRRNVAVLAMDDTAAASLVMSQNPLQRMYSDRRGHGPMGRGTVRTVMAMTPTGDATSPPSTTWRPLPSLSVADDDDSDGVPRAGRQADGSMGNGGQPEQRAAFIGMKSRGVSAFYRASSLDKKGFGKANSSS